MVDQRVSRAERTEIEAEDARASTRPRAKLNVEAFEAGEKARRASSGVATEAPPEKYAQHKSLLRSWREGWASAAAAIAELAPKTTTSIPVTVAPEVALHPLAFWPKDKPMPKVYRRPPIPCPNCRMLLRPKDGGRAVGVKAVNGTVAYFRCLTGQGCPDFKLPVER